MHRRLTILVSIICLCLPVLVFADSIILKSGKIVEGKIIEDTETYIKIETTDGQPLYYQKNVIATIKRNNEVYNFPSTKSGLKTGLLDCSDKGYMVFIPNNVSVSSAILVCLPGWAGVKTKQDLIGRWVFTAGKSGFVVLGLDVDYNTIRSFSDVDQLYSRMLGIIDSLAREYRINISRFYLVGTSAGAIISISLALRYPGRFVAIGVVSGGRLGFGAQEELSNAKGSRFYMVHGDRDERIPLREFQSTRKQLERNGAIIEYNIIPGGKHSLNSDAYNEVVNWLADLDSLLKP
jgi:predicted esterase